MLRRCLESPLPQFGMIMSPKSGVPNSQIDYGTMLQIRQVQMLSDGRSYVETMGSYRFRVLERGTLDGYTVGRIERQVYCPFFLAFFFSLHGLILESTIVLTTSHRQVLFRVDPLLTS